MALRTWIIRGVILAVLTAVGYGVWWAQSYVSPEAVRASLLSTLGEQFPDTTVTVGSAQIRVFGGISVRDLTITQKGATEPFFRAPVGTIYHDKEEINRGRLAIRKIELDGPELTLERLPNGRWGLEGLSSPGPTAAALPMFVVNKATVHVVDRSPKKLPRVTLTDANFTLINDPAPLFLNVKGSARASVADQLAVRFSLAARLNRGTGQLSLRADLPDVPLGSPLAGVIATVQPDAVEYIKPLTGRVDVKAEWESEPGRPTKYDVHFTLRDGHFEHALLPSPLTAIQAAAMFKDGKVTVENLSAKLGPATLDLTLETRPLVGPPPVVPIPAPSSREVPARLASRPIAGDATASAVTKFEETLERIEVTLRDLSLDDAFFDRLPDEVKKYRAKFSPTGTVAVGYRFNRPTPEAWKREFDFRPTKLAVVYDKFRYPLTDVTGLIRQTVTPDGEDAKVELTGTAGGQRIDVKGSVRGSGPDPALALKITGNNVPINDQLFDALASKRHAALLRSLHPTGRGDFAVDVKQQAGVNLVENTFRLSVYDGTVNYKAFPYSLDQVRAKVNIFVTTNDGRRPVRPGEPIAPLPETDRIEIRDVTARHGGGTIWMKGDNDAVPDSKDRRVVLHVWGKDCPIDEQFRESLTAVKLGTLWDVLQPRGKLSFAVDVDLLDRAKPNPAPQRGDGPLVSLTAVSPVEQLTALTRPAATTNFDPSTDLKLAFNFEGPSVTPSFFAYRLDELSGHLKYEGDRVKLEHFVARHGPSKLGLNAADVRFYDDGRVYANLGKMDVAPLIVDDALITALPRGLRDGVKDMNLRGPAELTFKHFVVLTPPESTAVASLALPDALPPVERDPEVYWNGEIRLDGAAFDAGVPCEKAVGKVACTGRYHPTHLGKVNGNLWLDSVLIASNPATAVKATFDADAQEPDATKPGGRLPSAFKFTDLQGTLFNGTVGGTGRVVLSDPVRYRLSLTATDIRLEDVAKFHNVGSGAKLEGAAQGSILLETAADATTGRTILTGYGKADVDRGHIYNLPPLAALLKALKLEAPNKTAFEEAHATFTLRGDRVRVDHVDLLGSAISLGGSGEMDTTGQYVKFDFYTIWSQTLQRWLTTPFGDVTAVVSEKLFKIEVTRKPDGEMKYEPRVVPFVTDPFKAVADRVRARAGRSPTARATGEK
ncbi:AsmA family protein [Limnoglobus roseus]|uniref:Uncharacterized protein n=1 Tax=Limnoglobus roseus TaxID=2598579 RepID=A0A5C1A7S6_9BACT|nr:hypothetical protein [Limnoglobus roseus]QEL15359.1 hypothetical protein PX52LOC_02274 [Limnoglobus roseus]